MDDLLQEARRIVAEAPRLIYLNGNYWLAHLRGDPEDPDIEEVEEITHWDAMGLLDRYGDGWLLWEVPEDLLPPRISIRPGRMDREELLRRLDAIRPPRFRSDPRPDHVIISRCPVELQGKGNPILIHTEDGRTVSCTVGEGIYPAFEALVRERQDRKGLDRDDLNKATGLEDARKHIQDLFKPCPELGKVFRQVAAPRSGPNGWGARFGLRWPHEA